MRFPFYQIAVQHNSPIEPCKLQYDQKQFIYFRTHLFRIGLRLLWEKSPITSTCQILTKKVTILSVLKLMAIYYKHEPKLPQNSNLMSEKLHWVHNYQPIWKKYLPKSFFPLSSLSLHWSCSWLNLALSCSILSTSSLNHLTTKNELLNFKVVFWYMYRQSPIFSLVTKNTF